jgi:plastocyanin
MMTIALVALAAPAVAQEWRMAPEYDVLLTSFEIQPQRIRLKAGEAVRLRFVNNSAQAHSFSAGAFFRSAQLRGSDRALIRGGTLRLRPFSDETLALVPKAGRYKVSGDNVFRRVLGMTATIVVE